MAEAAVGTDVAEQTAKARRAVLQPLAYMTVHMTGVVMTFLLARVFWESFRAHTLFLLFILCISVWNGAGEMCIVLPTRTLCILH